MDPEPSLARAMSFAIGAVTAALLNNDAAILLLTPLMVPMIARLYPTCSIS